MVRGLCPRDMIRGEEDVTGRAVVTRVQSVKPNVRNQPTLAVTPARGVEDAAPYGRQLNVGISIVVNRCAIAANLLPRLGSPERGAVAALCAVTEGLAQRGCGAITSFVDRRTPLTVGAGFHARPALVDGQRRFARLKWCAGCARGIEYAGRRTKGGSTVGEADAVGHAERPQPVNRGRHATQGRARRQVDARNRRCPSTDGGAPGTVRPTVRGERLTTNPRSPSSNGRGVGDAAPYGVCDRVRFCGAMRWAGSLGMVSRTRYVSCSKAVFAVVRRAHRPRCAGGRVTAGAR